MFALNANATSSQHNISGDFQVGVSIESYPLIATTAYSLKASCPANGIFSFNPASGIAAIEGSWPNTSIYQSLQLVNAFWDDGVIEGVTEIDFTINTQPTGTIDISISVSEDETPQVWGQRIVDTLNDDWFVDTGYKMRLTGTELIFESDLEHPDPLLVSINNAFDLSKPKASATQGMSSTLIAPQSPFGISGGTGYNFDGEAIGTIEPQAMLIKAATAFEVQLLDTSGYFIIPANGVVLLKELPEETQWVFTSSTIGSIEIVVVG
jgi:hypothetical protein